MRERFRFLRQRSENTCYVESPSHKFSFDTDLGKVEVKDSVAVIKRGEWVKKLKQQRFLPRTPKNVFLRVDMEGLRILWKEERNKREKCLLLTEVNSLQFPVMCLKVWKPGSLSEKIFGLKVMSKTRTDLFLIDSEDSWKIWIRGLLHAQHKAQVKIKNRHLVYSSDLWRKIWSRTDLDNSESVQFDECLSLLRSFNCKLDIQYVANLFYRNNQDDSNVLEYDEFLQFINSLLTHNAVLEVFRDFVDKNGENQDSIEIKDFGRFIEIYQNGKASAVAAALEVVSSYAEPFKVLRNLNSVKKVYEGITIFGFCKYLTGETNNLFSPAKQKCYQDMTKPLNHYWIKAHKNWYKFEECTFPGGSAEASFPGVKREFLGLHAALESGSRAFYLLCSSRNDEIQINFTLYGSATVGTLDFSEFLEEIKKEAFKVNKFPIIILLDLSNCISSGTLVESLLGSSLGNTLYLDSIEKSSPFPSPQSLAEKVIVLELPTGNFGKKGIFETLDTVVEKTLSNPFNVILEEDAFSRIDSEVRQDSGLLNVSYGCPGSFLNSETVTPATRGNQRRLFCIDNDFYNKLRGREELREKFRRVRINSICAKYFKTEENLGFGGNLVDFWAHGINIAPQLGHGSTGTHGFVSMLKFLENNKSGYLLMPNASIYPCNTEKDQLTERRETLIVLVVKVLAGQQLPRPPVGNVEHFNGISDNFSPFVSISVQGTPADYRCVETSVVMNNGLNPSWEEEQFSFNVSAPELAFLIFEIKHFDTIVRLTTGWGGVPVSCISGPGLRWVPLYDCHFRPIPWAGVLVHLSIRSRMSEGLTTV